MNFRERRRWVGRVGIALALTVLLAACATPPGPPLLSPVDLAHNYGYSDTAKGENHFIVNYLGPSNSSSVAPTQHESDAEQARTQAFDFAVWHGAQIAQAKGFEGFRITDKR